MDADARLVFGPFVLDDRTGMLLRNEMRVDLGQRGLALLRILVLANGQVVTKSDLMDGAWPNRTVEESNLTVQIAALRRGLGPAPSGGEWIVTVPGVGYRFAVPPTKPRAFQARDGGLPSEKPAIAVLPFANVSSDPEQEYFADGLAEDLITDLSRVAGLLVIARNSSFAYKGKSLDARQIARDLGVRYLVEGSVRRAANRLRITAQLIDARENAHIWADRFDRDMADVFALQDEVVAKIVSALSPVLPAGRPVSTQRARSLEAYDLFVRARVLAILSSEGNRTARPLLERSIAIEPDFVDALAWLAMTYHFGWLYWQEPEEPNRSLGRATAEKAAFLDANNPDARWILGYVRAYDGDLTGAVREFEGALQINPNHADAWALLADVMVLSGRPKEAANCAQEAFRLNPYPPALYYWALGWAEFADGRYEDAVETLRHPAAGIGGKRILAASLARLGRSDEARAEARLYMSTTPHFSVRTWARTQPFGRDADRQHFIDGFLMAGLPA